jgi:Cft2 family RNA processing exonuclease
VSVVPSPRFAPKKSVTFGFSGWAVDGYYAMGRGVDDAFVVSDHADFYELVQTVKKVSPEKVYVWHGFGDEFAAFLRLEGFDAIALKKNQHTLANFH